MYVRLAPTANYKHIKPSSRFIHKTLKYFRYCLREQALEDSRNILVCLAYKANERLDVFGVREHIIGLNFFYFVIP